LDAQGRPKAHLPGQAGKAHSQAPMTHVIWLYGPHLLRFWVRFHPYPIYHHG
jgi:hypothetical protein